MKLTIGLVGRSIAFRTTLLLFGGLNAWTWARHRYSPVCCDQEISFGFPFPFHISGGIMGESNFYILRLGPHQHAAGVEAGETAGEGEKQVSECAE
jgi:hypothetical protein